ncbi:hypothetical protein GTD56_004994 [Salmonella enterica subsp. diarizonae]|nr:hypothetical protein [Salmonella enterica subsp. diarizonae]
MGVKHFIYRLTEAQRAKLDKLIRQYGYGNLESLQKWLEKQGVSVSKNTISRYTSTLRSIDLVDGMGSSKEILISQKKNIAIREDLYSRLDRIENKLDRLLLIFQKISEEKTLKNKK